MTNWVTPWLACDLISWGRLILPHWRELRACHTGIILFVTAFAVLNTLLAPLQRCLLMLPWASTRAPRGPLFIIGHWRSGTTVLHHLLSLDPQFTYPNNYACFAPHHFLLTEWLLQSGFNWLAPLRRPMDTLPLGAQDPQEDEFALLGLGAASPYADVAFPQGGLRMSKRLDQAQADQCQTLRWQKKLAWFVRALTFRHRRRVVLKSPTHSWRVRTLLAMYPDSQFVCLTRSPFDTVASTISVWKAMCASYALGSTSSVQWEEAAIDDYVAFQQTLCQTRGLLGPGQYQEIAFEQLLNDPLATMRRVYASLNLGEFDLTSPAAIRYLQAIKNHQPQSHVLSDSAKQHLESRILAMKTANQSAMAEIENGLS
jgi:omega-hydroxy-beta-dihydromenaquinone-9 sulfotransferase